MNNKILKTTALSLAVISLLSGGVFANKAYAADESGIYLKGAKFLVAVDAKADDGKELIMAMYSKKGGDVFYLSDGKNHVYTDYTTEEGFSADVGYYQDIYINGEPFYRYCQINNKPHIISSDGEIYSCEYLDDYQMRQYMSYD